MGRISAAVPTQGEDDEEPPAETSMGRISATVPTQGEDDEEPPAETDSSTESKPPTGPAPHNRGAAGLCDYSTIDVFVCPGVLGTSRSSIHKCTVELEWRYQVQMRPARFCLAFWMLLLRRRTEALLFKRTGTKWFPLVEAKAM